MAPRWIVPTTLFLCLLGAVSAHAENITVTTDKLVFAPADVKAKVGDTIEWTTRTPSRTPPRRPIKISI